MAAWASVLPAAPSQRSWWERCAHISEVLESDLLPVRSTSKDLPCVAAGSPRAGDLVHDFWQREITRWDVGIQIAVNQARFQNRSYPDCQDSLELRLQR